MVVYEPSTMAEALSRLVRSSAPGERPERAPALVMAGGTYLMSRRREWSRDEGRPLVSLHRLDALSRITRTQRHLDIGAAATLSRILSIGPNVIPDSLFAAIKSVATPSVRVLATLGGNLCSAGGEHTTLASLCALGAQLELRSAGGARWVPVTSLVAAAGRGVSGPEEILTRIRLPLAEYDVEVFRREEVRIPGAREHLHFCAVARLRHGVTQELRMAMATRSHGVLRSTEFEARCAGLGLPVPPRARAELREVLDLSLQRFLGLSEEQEPQRRVALARTRDLGLRLWDWFLAGLRSDEQE